MRLNKKLCLLLLCCALFCLCSCSVLAPVDVPASAVPNLHLLAMSPYEDQELSAAPAQSVSPLRVDLWLDASQLMGGINANPNSLYPHSSRKYREGGFHYRYENTVGFYENVLRGMLATAEGSLVRVLRYGNERLPDSFLFENGLANPDAHGDALRSLRRDMLTYAINPMPSLFSEFSAEDMTDSFYALGTPKLNQAAHFSAESRALLENPAKTAQMSTALANQITAIAANPAGSLTAVGVDTDAPLLYALQNIDLTRLSIITCDPAALRRLSGINADGSVTPYVQALLEERGVFDKGLCVGLYAFHLDYMGQISSFGPADFSEPLVWGRLRYSSKTHTSTAALPMPRTLLTLLIGKPEQVEPFALALNAQLEADPALKQLRGDDRGELVYTKNGQTVVQQPFAFAYHFTCIARPSAGFYSQHTPYAELTVSQGEGSVADGNGLRTVLLSLSAPNGTQNRTLQFTFPAQALPKGVQTDLSKLQNARADVLSALLLEKTLPLSSSQSPQGNAQIITLRDMRYVFTETAAPFEGDRAQSPFALEAITLDDGGEQLTVTVSVNSAKLALGYYRLRLYADSAKEQFAYAPVDWISKQSVTLSNEQCSAWESFTQLITANEHNPRSIPKQFQHAWGSAETKTYHDIAIPDCPPVDRAPGLSELYDQIRAASSIAQTPFLRCVFDVLVTSGEGF
ncbi:MAG: hypothetical protein RR379_03985 [Clostridia bacterium]